LGIHIVLDNFSTHKTASIQRRLAKRPRYHLRFTPTGASWINMVVRWFAELTNKQIRRGVHRSTRDLEQAIKFYLKANNENPKTLRLEKNRGRHTGQYCSIL
jgi:transposase